MVDSLADSFHDGWIGFVGVGNIGNPMARQLIEADAGIAYIDAPVTVGVAGAEQGALTVLGSGDADVVDRVRPLLDVIGANI